MIDEGITPQHSQWKERSWVATPREFIGKYIRFLPWIILAVSIALVFAWVKLRYTMPQYSASGNMLVRSESRGNGNDKLEELLQNKQMVNIRNEVEVLKSSILALRVVKALGLRTQYLNIGKVKNTVLYNDSPFRLQIEGNTDSLAAFTLPITAKDDSRFIINHDNKKEYLYGETFTYAGARMRLLLSGKGSPSQAESKEYSINWTQAENAVGLVTGSLNVSIVGGNTTILGISILSGNPEMASDIINQLMKEYNAANVEEKNQTSVNTLAFIDERLDTIRAELSGVERAVQRFSETNKAINLESQTESYIENLSESGNEIIQQQVKLNIVEYLINYLSTESNKNKLVPSVLNVEEPTLPPLISSFNQMQLERQTKLQTVPATNQIIVTLDQNIEKLRQDIIESLNNVKRGYQIALSSMENKSRQTESQLLSLPGKGKQLAEISRQQKILEELYKFLLTKKIETSISSASTISNSRVLEPAVASWIPVKPDKKAAYFVSLFFGLAIPIGLIALREYLNDKIETKAEVEKLTPVPIIGEIGHVDKDEILVAKSGDRSYVAEQFRMVRTNMQFVLSKIEKPVILLTSSFSGEGKSFISTNIGGVMAMAGKKTVILELDIRKPKVTTGL